LVFDRFDPIPGTALQLANEAAVTAAVVAMNPRRERCPKGFNSDDKSLPVGVSMNKEKVNFG
jgi:hypothetical protein